MRWRSAGLTVVACVVAEAATVSGSCFLPRASMRLRPRRRRLPSRSRSSVTPRSGFPPDSSAKHLTAGLEVENRGRIVLNDIVLPTDAPSWAAPVMLVDSFNRREHGDGGVEAEVGVPPGLSRVVLRYISTGHCTDGRDDDEFESKANVISVDGRVVARIHPWRDDCRGYRERNPHCSRWADGSWSSDYARSGWCPGVEVLPAEFDLTDHLGPGKHRVKVVIEEMRPEDAQGNYGYWRVSAALVGWDRPPRLWRN
jgi:hypothetical protein